MTYTVVIAGVGPGLGESLARKFVAEGCSVGLFARSEDYLTDLEADLQTEGADALAVPTDVTNPEQVTAGFERVREEFGPIDVLVNHAGNYLPGGLLDIEPGEFERMWRIAAYGGLLCSQEAVSDMLGSDDGGTVIFTGATSALRGPAKGLAFGSAKFAVRGMAESMARDLGPEGVHVAHVIIDSQIFMPGARERQPDRNEETFLDPDAIADSYWHLAEQDRSAWTLELDLRPHVEDF